MGSSGLTTLSIAAAFSLAASAAMADRQPDVGKPAPAFSARDADGKKVDLSSLRGKPVLLEWTNNGCPYVGHVYRSGVMQGLQKRAAGQGVVWLTVISSAPGKQGYLTPPEVKRWKADTGAAPASVLLDPNGAVGHAYAARATPTIFIIDPGGTLIYEGGIDDRPSTDPTDALHARNYVAAALDDMKMKRPIADAVTRPYGCSVKY
ncbi:MAG TPA: redoxin domain-containing protein [Caulobacteraceae bacterium]|jgi:hypothetical protein|nr:redoxin domain-containing protein [Caulobacteraceae bacterium]